MHVCKDYGPKRKNKVSFAFSAGRSVSKDCGLLLKDGGRRAGGTCFATSLKAGTGHPGRKE